MRRVALKEQPKLIVAGASAYPRVIDFAKFREIADEVGAYFMVDMAHIAGLVAAGEHPSPVPYADFVTTTTHKTLRGPRGGLILCKKEHAALLDKKVFPGMQGGPLMHIIAAKAVCLQEAMQPEFKEYAKQIIANCAVMSNTLKEEGFRIVSGGTDNHLILVDVKSSLNMSGKFAEKLLDEAGITCNKNTIPFETEKLFAISGNGIRLRARQPEASRKMNSVRLPYDQPCAEKRRKKRAGSARLLKFSFRCRMRNKKTCNGSDLSLLISTVCKYFQNKYCKSQK